MHVPTHRTLSTQDLFPDNIMTEAEFFQTIFMQPNSMP